MTTVLSKLGGKKKAVIRFQKTNAFFSLPQVKSWEGAIITQRVKSFTHFTSELWMVIAMIILKTDLNFTSSLVSGAWNFYFLTLLCSSGCGFRLLHTDSMREWLQIKTKGLCSSHIKTLLSMAAIVPLPRAEEAALPRPPKADALLRGCKNMRAGGRRGTWRRGAGIIEPSFSESI